MTHLKDVAKASFSKEISKDKQDWTVSVVGNFVETQVCGNFRGSQPCLSVCVLAWWCGISGGGEDHQNLLLRWDPQTVKLLAMWKSYHAIIEWPNGVEETLCISIFLLGGIDGWINILMLLTKQVLRHCIAALFVSDASERNQIIQLCQE